MVVVGERGEIHAGSGWIFGMFDGNVARDRPMPAHEESGRNRRNTAATGSNIPLIIDYADNFFQ